jgi:starch synthase
MKIAIVTSEAAPFSKTGGLADVTGALFSEYVQMGHNTSLFVPLYRETRERLGASIEDIGIEITVPLGGDAKVCRVFRFLKDAGRGAVFLIGNDEFFDRDELYGNARGD